MDISNIVGIGCIFIVKALIGSNFKMKDYKRLAKYGLYVWLIVCLVSLVNSSLDTDVYSYWTIDDSSIVSGTFNSSVNSNYATNNGGTAGLAGVINEAVGLDGSNDYLNATYSLTGSISVFCYINQTSQQTGDGYVHKDNFFNDAGQRDWLWSTSLTDNTKYVLYIWQTDATLDSIESNTTITLNSFDYLGFTYNSSDGEMELFKNGVGVGRKTHSGGAKGVRSTHDFLYFGRTQDNAETSRYLQGRMDECILYNRSLSNEEASDLYSEVSSGTQYPFTTPPTPSILVNTSLFLIDFNVSDITFSTNTYFDAFVIEYNLTERVNITLVSAFNVEKLSGGGTNEIFGRIIRNEGTLHEELIRTVSGTGNVGSTGFYPIVFEEDVGSHNLTFQYRRTGNGNILIDNSDFILMQGLSTELNPVRMQENRVENSFTSTGFEKIANITVTTDVQTPVGIFTKVNINSTLNTISNYRFSGFLGNGTDRFRRSILSSSEVGTLTVARAEFIPYVANYSLEARTDSNPVTVNASIIDFDLKDKQNNTINLDFIAYNQTQFNAGTHLMYNFNYTPVAGDAVLLYSLQILNSTTGLQTPNFIINSSNSTVVCKNQKDRTLPSNSAIGHAYSFTLCNGGLEVNKSYQFNSYVEVGTGETLNVEYSSLTAFDVTQFNITKLDTPKSMTVNTNLTNNTINYNLDTLNISYNFTIGIFNTIDQANCTLIINGVDNETQSLRNDSVNYQFQLNNVGKETEYNLSVDCLNTEVSASSGVFNYKIDTVSPRIESTFSNNSQQSTGNPITFYVNFTDPNLLAYNITWFDINGNVNQNLFANNLTGGFAENTSTYTEVAVTNGSIYVQAWDSHTTNKLKYDIEKINDYTYDYHGVLITSDKKLYTKKETDKYMFEIDKKAWLCYHSDTGFTRVENSGYPNHYIDFANWIWIDEWEYTFIETVENGTITQLCFFNDKEEKYISNSIGDLNFNEATYYYSVVDSSVLNNLLLQQILQAINNQTNNQTTLENQKEGYNMYLWFWIFAVLILILVMIFHKNVYLFFLGLPVSVLFVYIGVAMFDDLVTASHPTITNALYLIQWAYTIIVVLAILMRGMIMFFQVIGLTEKKEDEHKMRDMYGDYKN